MLKNFLTNFGSSMFSPNAADLDAISDCLPTKLSILSISFILSLSNSDIRVCNLDSFTLSAPMCRALMAAHIFFVLSMSPTCSTSSSVIDWKIKATVMSFFSISANLVLEMSHAL